MTEREQLFEEKYDLYNQMVYNIAFSYLKDYNDALDVMQESFLGFYNANKTFKTLNDEKYYLIRIVINNCKTLLKKNKKHFLLDEEVLDALKEDSKIEDLKVIDMIQVLKPIYKEVIILIYVENMSNKEVAAALNISEANVRKRHERALKTLREHWELKM